MTSLQYGKTLKSLNGASSFYRSSRLGYDTKDFPLKSDNQAFHFVQSLHDGERIKLAHKNIL